MNTFHHDRFIWANSNPFDILVDDDNGPNRLKVDAAVFTITIQEDEARTQDGGRFNSLPVGP